MAASFVPCSQSYLVALPCSVLENVVFLKLMSSLAPLLHMPAAYIYYLDNVRTIGQR